MSDADQVMHETRNDSKKGEIKIDERIVRVGIVIAKAIISFVRLRIITYIYLVATLVGFFYADSYYGRFGIEFLSFASVTDFVLIALTEKNSIVEVLIQSSAHTSILLYLIVAFVLIVIYLPIRRFRMWDNLSQTKEAYKSLNSGSEVLHKAVIYAILLMLVLWMIFLAVRLGQLKADCIIADTEDKCGLVFESGSKNFGDTMSFIISTIRGGQEKRYPKNTFDTFVIPTANLAALNFVPSKVRKNQPIQNNSQKSQTGQLASPSADGIQSTESLASIINDEEKMINGSGIEQDCSEKHMHHRKYVRVAIQKDGMANLPNCLVHIGATADAQFLVAFGDEDSKCPDGEPDDTVDRDCKLVAKVGPFPIGEARLCKEDSKDDTCRECVGNHMEHGGNCDFSDLVGIDGLVSRIKDRKVRTGEVMARILLIGRADSQPIDNECFRSNSGLAQARAEWVWSWLRLRLGEQANSINAVRTTAGPLWHGDPADMRDRSVEVHICWKSAQSGA